jgi:hypothetical protein
MTVVTFKPIAGEGSTVDRSVELVDAIKAACYDIADGVALSVIIGCLEIAKLEMIEENRP